MRSPAPGAIQTEVEIIKIEKSSPPPCRGRAREGVEGLWLDGFTPIQPFPLQGGRGYLAAIFQFPHQFESPPLAPAQSAAVYFQVSRSP